jgi:hypothetical protein
MLEGYLSDLYKQTNLLKPEIVRSLFPYLMLASESANGGGNDHDEIVLEEDEAEETNNASSAYGETPLLQPNGRDENAAMINEEVNERVIDAEPLHIVSRY